MPFFELVAGDSGWCWGRIRLTHAWRGGRLAGVLLAGLVLAAFASTPCTAEAQSSLVRTDRQSPPRVKQAQRFLSQRGFTAGQTPARLGPMHGIGRQALAQAASTSATTSTATWQTLGPAAVLTPSYGLVTGRVSAVALDPSDTTGNRLYVGTTGGGVWVAQNAGTSNAANVVFTPLTDTLASLSGIQDASISIGALTVQPGGTGVILAGTGDPNDALDSYYGAGILRSADGGNTWSLIQTTADLSWGFAGEGFAGFAWSTATPQLVVAAVAQAHEGTLVNADRPRLSYEGLYYSNDSGTTWNLATITDGPRTDVQGPSDPFAGADGNAATSVVWNPVRQLFVAAVRFHGYYQSADGITWTRMTAQPGAGLAAAMCPTNAAAIGSIACPIFRGTLAVNPQTGDTFAWTVDLNNQDQGLWQDQCTVSAGVCTNPTISFAQRWGTTALETSTAEGPATIENGDYTLALAAVPSQQDTVVLAGDGDVWRCSLAMGCAWRNTTNANTCMSAQVAPYQHALGWSSTNPLEMFVGNDSGLWRSLDAIGETGSVCSATDANHFENLNGNLGSLAEVMSLSQSASSPYTMMAGLSVNGTAGVKGASGPTAQWPQVLGGDGGAVAIDPTNEYKWYVNAEEGVSIYLCDQVSDCAPANFGTSPVVSDADVGGDGLTMTTPAPFLVDPLDETQLLIGTCRVWRGPANGVGWTSANAISPILDSGNGGPGSAACNGDALIRSISAMALAAGNEMIYVGTYGSADGGTLLPGHVLSATVNPASSAAGVWHDLTFNPVTNDSLGLNAFGLDISSIYIDQHDATGNTVYVTVEGIPSQPEAVRVLYRTTDGGAHWAALNANLPWAPANSVVVDPQSANTVYLATDAGVYFTTQVGSCANLPSTCWSAFGTGLAEAPVTELSASASAQVLVAGTYGRGVWETPLWSATTGWTSATVAPGSLTFGSEVFGTASIAQTLTLTNTGTLGLTTSAITVSGDFSETDNCQPVTVAAGTSCTINVTFTPTATGSRTGQMTIDLNVYGGQLLVDLSGTGTAAGLVSLTPATVSFGAVAVGATSSPLQVEAGNSGSLPLSITSLTVTPPFAISSNACGTSALAADTDCQIMVEFLPTQMGAATGTLTLVDEAGTQTVALSGTGEAPPTDTLGATSLSFAGTIVGQLSTAQTVSLTNSGGLPLTSIAVTASGAFQQTNNCSTQLTGPANCSISVVFAPSQVGIQTGTLTVSDLLRTQTVALTGIGLLPPAISVNPTSLSFAAQQVGVASPPATLTVTNSGGAPMANVGFQLTGNAASSFAVGTTTCGATLANGSSCTVQVTFTPASAGGSAAALVVSSSTLGVTPVSVSLNGTGTTTTGLNVSPTQLSFSEEMPGQASPAQTVTISNTGSIAATALVVTVSPQFSLTQNSCGSSLASGASCTVGVVFQPTAPGKITGTLTVTSASAANAATVALSGTGGGVGAIQATPAVQAFGSVGVGVTSGPATVTVTNPGTGALSGLALAASPGFALVNNTCTATLASGASCTVGVEFAPTAAGAQTGSLSITSSTASASGTVSLTGTGFDFTVASGGTLTMTVSNGQTADYTVDITPMAGAQGTFTFACGTLPANAVCLFNPSTETLNAGVTGNVTVEISVGQSGATTRLNRPGAWKLVPMACVLLFLPLGWKRRRKALVGCVLLAILAGGLSSCASSGGGTGGGGGGGTGGGGGGGTTPAGTYSIPVNVTSTGVQHSLTVTLTVD
ncbi:MAG: choice-of-anchor D domain-containing protein [Terracidiphilus sp.]